MFQVLNSCYSETGIIHRTKTYIFRLVSYILCITSCLLFLNNTTQAQILNDNAVRQQISTGLEKMYAYDFKESTEIFNKIKSRYPQHPVGYLLQAIQLELQYFPLKDYPTANKQYLALLNSSRNLSEVILDKNDDDLEANFFELATLGYLAAYNADNGEMMKAVGIAKKAYGYLKFGLKQTDKQPEFLYSSGIYNYYRIEYPETHTMIKPFMFFFVGGDKKLGLQQLDLASRKTIFVKNEAIFYAGYVYMKYESNPAKALSYNNLLTEKYPDNLLYKMQRMDILNALNKHSDAEDLAEELLKQKGQIFQCAGTIFKGLVAEKSKKDDKVAEVWLQKGIKMPFEERFTKDYHALAYVALARIAKRIGDATKAKAYAKKAIDIAEYKSTLAEAKTLAK